MPVIRNVGLFLVFSCIYISCTSKKDEGDKELHANIKLNYSTSVKKDFVLIDSIIVNGLSTLYFVIADYNPKTEKYLAFDPIRNNEIFEFDKHGIIKHRLQLLGNGKEQYGDYLYGLGYYNDSLICIISNKGASLYNFNGHIVNRIPVKLTGNNADLQLKKVGPNSVCSAAIPFDNNEGLNNLSPEYFKKRKNITKFNFFDSSYTSGIQFEDSSIYLNTESWYSNNLTCCTYNTQDSMLLVLYQLEKRIYFYKLNYKNAFDLAKTLDLQPEYFPEPTGINYKNELSQIDLVNIGTSNPSFNHVYSYTDTTYVVYSKGILKNELKNEDYGSASLNNLKQTVYQEYVEVYKDSQKICQDIKVPEIAAGISYILPQNRYLMAKKKPKQIANEEKQIIYIYELQ